MVNCFVNMEQRPLSQISLGKDIFTDHLDDGGRAGEM